jgi:capsular polysaccharide biosynthesis protein
LVSVVVGSVHGCVVALVPTSIAYDFEIPPFKTQLDLWSSHGVIVCAHGAGLMNMLFMPAFGAVVEVFPNHFHHNLYSALAAMMGQGHFPVHPSSAAPMWATEPVRNKLILTSYC